MGPSFSIRPARPDDSLAIFQLIQLLAEYEKAPEMIINTPEKIRKHGFGDNPLFLCWVAESESGCLGMALCYVRYSTWKGPVLYLEDIVVKDEHRRQGIGTALFQQCLDHARQNGFARLSWQVLDWNEPAIKFYEKYGANFDGEWVNCSLDLSNEPMD